jgi:hypothetical protein
MFLIEIEQILPPVSKSELDTEVKSVLGRLGKEKQEDIIDENEFIDACLDNSYWKSAGLTNF